MATRFYFPVSSGSAAVEIAPDAGWAVTDDFLRGDSTRARTNTTLTTGDARTKNSTALSRRLDRQYVTDAISADQTIAGTFSAVFRCSESVSSHNSWLDFIIRVVSGDGTVVRGTLWAGSPATAVGGASNTESGEMPAGVFQTRFKNALALTSVDALAGDRLVIEVGYKADSTSTTTASSIVYGDPDGVADHGLSSGISTPLVPWLELSQTLTFSTAVRLMSASGSGEAGGSATTIMMTLLSAAGSGISSGAAYFGHTWPLTAIGEGLSQGAAALSGFLKSLGSGSGQSAGTASANLSGVRGPGPGTSKRYVYSRRVRKVVSSIRRFT